jgi:two-component sensor histidine kinase
MLPDSPQRGRAALHPDAPVSLDEILCTENLYGRPPRTPDYATENRALCALVKALAESPSSTLQTLADTVLDVLKADSAGLSLLDKGGDRFYWPAIAGAWRPHLGGGTPRNFGPCGDVLDQNAPLMFKHWERRYPYLREAAPYAEEGLLVPFYVAGKAVGTIWVIAHDQHRKFDREDLRLLESLGRFASAAYQAVELEHTLDERRKAEERQQLLIDELNHRVKNTLATVQSIATHTLSGIADAERHGAFDARLIALSCAHDLLARRSWESASLRDLLLQQLVPYQSRDAQRFVVEGPPVELRPKVALALGLAFHELTTNAAKYGALSAPTGCVHVRWAVDETSKPARLRLTWRETGGPSTRNPGRRGFGMTVIERGLSLELNGDVAVEFAADGLVCAMNVPLSAANPR